jgi:hypothetical protein
MYNERIMKSSVIFTLMIAIGILAGTLKAQGDSEVNPELAQVRAATAKYHDINVAIADGFGVIGAGNCVDSSSGTHGIGYVNIPRFLSPEVDPLEPEILNYIPTGDGNLRLVNVVYTNRVMFRDTRPPDTPGYRPGVFPLTSPVIAPHFEEVSGEFELFGQQPERLFDGRWMYLLSAWVWSPNPNGMFAGTNPRLNCTGNN